MFTRIKQSDILSRDHSRNSLWSLARALIFMTLRNTALYSTRDDKLFRSIRVVSLRML